MYFLNLIGFKGFSCEVHPEDIEVCTRHSEIKPEPTISEFKDLATIIMEEEELPMPTDINKALKLYFTLLDALIE